MAWNQWMFCSQFIIKLGVIIIDKSERGMKIQSIRKLLFQYLYRLIKTAIKTNPVFAGGSLMAWIKLLPELYSPDLCIPVHIPLMKSQTEIRPFVLPIYHNNRARMTNFLSVYSVTTIFGYFITIYPSVINDKIQSMNIFLLFENINDSRWNFGMLVVIVLKTGKSYLHMYK